MDDSVVLYVLHGILFYIFLNDVYLMFGITANGLWYIILCSVGMVSSASGLFDVDVIVLDEVHYLSDISRGTVWEEIVSAFIAGGFICPGF